MCNVENKNELNIYIIKETHYFYNMSNLSIYEK